MNHGRTVLAQLLDAIGSKEFERIARRYPMKRDTPAFSAYDHFATMIFSQLTFRESLRDLEACLGARQSLLYHSGIRGRPTRTNIAYANENRDWRLFSDLASFLMKRAHGAYQTVTLPIDLDGDLFALDSSIIDLSLKLFPWAKWQGSQSAMKLNLLLDLRGNIPAFASLEKATSGDVLALDEIPVYPGCYYVIDRGYVDLKRLQTLNLKEAYFVTRFKRNLRTYVVTSNACADQPGIRCDQHVRFSSSKGRKAYPDLVRRIRFKDPQTERSLIFLTNNLVLEANVIAMIYRHRWQVELFFKWIKQHLQIHSFLSLSENGIRIQIWSALCTYLLVALLRHACNLPGSLHQVLRTLSIASLEKVPVQELFTGFDTTELALDTPIQLNFNGF